MIAGAQKSSMKYGKIDPAHLAMTHYDADTSAGALVLGDIGEINITYDNIFGFRVEFNRHVRIKVFNSNGFDLANFKIPYYNFRDLTEKITKLKATSYNLEGGKIVETDIARSDIFIEEVSLKEQSQNFSVPNIKKGTVFEVEYHITSDLLWALKNWEFQYTVPAVFSELTVTIPEYFNYKTLMKGYVQPTVSDSKKVGGSIFIKNSDGSGISKMYTALEQKFRFENIPAFNEEPFMNSISNYLSSVEFELASVNFPYSHRDYTTTWEKISSDLLKENDFGVQLKRNCPIKEEAEILRSKYSDPKERMINAYELIRNTMIFNDSYGIYITKTLRKAWDEKKGKAADINLLLVSLLNEIGVEADPVLISTRKNGIIHPAQIMLTKFNYVIAEARIGDETYLLDATDKKLPYNMLPERCLNGEGRRISQTKELNDWVTINGEEQNERVLFCQSKVEPSGNIKGEFNLMESRYFAYERARKIKAENSIDDYATKYEATFPGLMINEIEIENLDDRSQQLVLKYKADYNLSDDSPKDLIYINPSLGNGINSNPFIPEKREFPVDFINPWSSKIINILTLPEGYQVEELPKNALITLLEQLGSFKYTIAATNNQIQLMTQIIIRDPLIVATNYSNIREFYSMIVAKYAEKVVLKKL